MFTVKHCVKTLKDDIVKCSWAAVGDVIRRYRIQSEVRVTNFARRKQTVRLFTDGAVEPSLASCGAVIFVDDKVEFFSFVVPPDLLAEWASLGSTHAVAQVELLPVIIARHIWACHLTDAFVVLFIDYSSVLDTLIKGNTRSVASLTMVGFAAVLEMQLRAVTWVTRVPSPSNIADGPSRLEYRLVLSIPGARQVVASLPPSFPRLPRQPAQ
jgi:hypothetical protein